nr:MAG TPA: hypothetical protein [Caudoviricetes sp.]
MEGFTFKNLSDIDTLDQPTDKTKLVGMENGTPVQIPADGLRTDRVFVIDTTANDWETNRVDPDYGDKVKAALLRGDSIWMYYAINASTTEPPFRYMLVGGFGVGNLSNGKLELWLYPYCYAQVRIYCHDK